MATKKYKVIGKRLQDARIKNGWSLDQVQIKLQISKRYLMALEAGEDDDLPGDYYTQSLIKQYAQLLDLDLGSQSIKSEPQSIKEWRRDHAEVTSRSQRDEKQKKSVLMGLIHQHPWLMSCALIIVIWLLVWGAVNDMVGRADRSFTVHKNPVVMDTTKKHHKIINQYSKKKKKHAKIDKVKPLKIEQVDGSSENLKVNLSDDQKIVKLKMKMDKDSDSQSWNGLSMTSPSTKSVWQGVMNAGEDKHFTLKKSSTYVLKIGNTSNMDITIGGHKLPESTNATSIVRTVTLTIN